MVNYKQDFENSSKSIQIKNLNDKPLSIVKIKILMTDYDRKNHQASSLAFETILFTLNVTLLLALIPTLYKQKSP